MKEYDLIRMLAERFPRSRLQHNALFECDAEIVRIGEEIWGLTLDEFSPEEDLFTSEDPARLGSNLAVATLSDLFAAGVDPKFFMHGVSLPRLVQPEFADGLMQGIRNALDAAGCALCGGDVGTADPWRFCGFAMGPVRSARALTRRLPEEPQTLWVTGALGDANLAALRGAPTPQFELRGEEAGLIRSCATGCIDTSGGLFDAVWLLREQNPELRFDIRLGDVPLAAGIPEAADATGFAPEAALLGGAGEYELLFAVHEARVSELENKLRSVGVSCIGTTRGDKEPGVRLHRSDGSVMTMTEPPPCPRSAVNAEAHAQDVMTMAVRLFGPQK